MDQFFIQPSLKIILGIIVWTMIPCLAFANPQAEQTQSTLRVKTKDIVASLWQRIEAGEVSLDETSDQAFLKSLLRELHIPVESQVLVFSKTSLQKSKISPLTPRAIYFNEDCYVGWVQNGDIEIAVSEPAGSMQYYLVHKPKPANTKPSLVRTNQCLSCHVRGELQVQSLYTRDTGYPIGDEERYTITYQSPLSERWGGWYVTGQHGSDLHMGNVTADSGPHGAQLDRLKGANVKSLKSWFPIEPYLVHTSDIVALMVLEHQYVVHNALHEAAQSVGRQIDILHSQDSRSSQTVETLKRITKKRAEEIVDLLLFEGEYPLKSEGIKGSPDFQTAFRKNAQKSSAGRSLKDFDLNTRLFKYRCSYMIHSTSFKSLPEVLRRAVYERLDQVLAGKETSGAYNYLSMEERQNIRQILLETEPDAKRYWSNT